MALIDVIKCELNSNDLVIKYPSEDLKLGTQLVVYPGQSAFFVKGGQIFDEFQAGTYTLKTQNIPLLNKIINLPFGGDTPFKAEVWFVNQLSSLDSKWGTTTPLQIEDPKYGIIVPVRAYGQYGFKISDPRIFLENFVGNSVSFSRDKVDTYFKGKLLSVLTNLISTKINQDKISIVNINSFLTEISEYVGQNISPLFCKYGVLLEDFNVISINVPQDDPSFLKLKEAIDLAAQLKIAGKDVYQMNKSFDVLSKAAENEGTSGTIMNMGMGLAAGLNMGNQIGNMAAQNINTNIQTPPPLNQANYFLAINGQQQGPFDMNTIVNAIQNGQISPNILAWKQGMSNWSPINTFLEFSSMFNSCPPPVPPTI